MNQKKAMPMEIISSIMDSPIRYLSFWPRKVGES